MITSERKLFVGDSLIEETEDGINKSGSASINIKSPTHTFYSGKEPFAIVSYSSSCLPMTHDVSMLTNLFPVLASPYSSSNRFDVTDEKNKSSITRFEIVKSCFEDRRRSF